jgi:hypothetical protein
VSDHAHSKHLLVGGEGSPRDKRTRILDGAETMGDDDDGAAHREALQRLLHKPLALGVKRTAQ